MLFNSVGFLIFFPVVTLLYFALPHRYRWVMLLTASCYFYMAFVPVYILILFFTIAIDYVAGITIEDAHGSRRRFFLVLSLVANIGVLAIFKYCNFINANLEGLADFIHWNYPIRSLQILLPIGLSFHTFQSMSYTIEVYRGNYKAERNPGIFALYVMFYPQLVAGPIERPQNLLHQFYQKHEFDYARVTDGLKLMAWGFFKKVVIADRLAILVNQVYNHPTEYSGFGLLVATVFFAYQIYCDFSGYSDIAIGAAQVMGFKLMTNFNRPYFARSISEFWKRWHISLSTWFRDYLYIPLGGNRKGHWRWQMNLFLTFLISGFWHGANWTFVIWGGLNGSYLLFSLWTRKIRSWLVATVGLDKSPALHKWLQVATTFALVCFAWIFFRANNISSAFYIVSHLFSGYANLASLSGIEAAIGSLPLAKSQLAIAVASIIFLEMVHLLQRRRTVPEIFVGRPLWLRWATYYSLTFAILIFGVFNESQFIYFQF